VRVFFGLETLKDFDVWVWSSPRFLVPGNGIAAHVFIVMMVFGGDGEV